ncbi:hypothetical protein PTKIN_Ptkin16aG0495200 [Pterospermum kingtungense]
MDLTLINRAGETGDIESLYNIIQGDVFIFERVDEVPFIDTPLHKAASAGHIPFAMEMMNLKPSFARKLNPDGFSPMHLALQNDRAELVLQLLKIDKSLVRVKVREGKTPFHYAAEIGGPDLIKPFLKACPECIQDVTVMGRTALHLALQNDRVAEIEAILRWLDRYQYHQSTENWIREALKCRDIDGDTVLHVAATKDQAQVVQTLLLTFKLKKDAKNSEGLTALDIIERQRNEREVNNDELMDISRVGKPKTFMLKILYMFKALSINISRDSQRMATENRSAFLVVAGLILTATYNAALNPPGGVWASTDNSGASMNTTSNHALNGTSSALHHKPGTAIMSTKNFSVFWFCNSFTFWITLMLVSYLLPVEFFKALGDAWAEFVKVDEDTAAKNIFDVAKLLIMVESRLNIPPVVSVKMRDHIFRIIVSCADESGDDVVAVGMERSSVIAKDSSLSQRLKTKGQQLEGKMRGESSSRPFELLLSRQVDADVGKCDFSACQKGS